jgi:hypothetical protein
MTIRKLVCLGAMLALTACDLNPFGSTPPTFVVAQIEGAVEDEYNGSGEYTLGVWHWGAQFVMVSSHGHGRHENESMFFNLFLPSGYRPGPATYALSMALIEDEPINAVRGIYVRRSDTGAGERFISTHGELVVTRWKDGRIEGRFNYHGVLYPQDRVIPPDAPVVTVGGSFAAQLRRLCSVPHEGGIGWDVVDC